MLRLYFEKGGVPHSSLGLGLGAWVWGVGLARNSAPRCLKAQLLQSNPTSKS